MCLCIIPLKYICCWSGGKDSTASIILAHEHGEPLDIILFSEVMYDRKRGISGENPEHIRFIRDTKALFENWGYEVHILHADTDYLEFFNRIITKATKRKEHNGMKFGFPVFGMCGVKRDCKEKPIKDYISKVNDEIIQYVGICADEEKRLESLHKQANRISLLEKYRYTEEMAKKKCEEYGLLSPCYKYSNRGGCWFCPNAKLTEHKEIKRLYPEIWNEFVALENEENIANSKWNVYGRTLHEVDKNIFWEEQQMTIFDYQSE